MKDKFRKKYASNGKTYKKNLFSFWVVCFKYYNYFLLN